MNRLIVIRVMAQRLSMLNQYRPMSSGVKKNPKVTLTNDGTAFVCWHPKELFPYENTLPYNDEHELTNKSQALNYSTLVKGKNLFEENQRLVMEQVQAMTYTPRHVWKRRRFDGLQMRPSHQRKGV